jgi:hypothetical protein
MAGVRWMMVAVWLGWAGAANAACYDYAQDPSKLVDLEADATKGALSQDTKDCLEQNYQSASIQTTKGKISRVLLVNAYAYDTATWAKLVQRHLDEVERSDPNIAYLYAFYLYNRENPDYDAVIKWCEVALERRTEWTGDTLVGRTYQLHRTRAYAAYQAWRDAEESQKPETDAEEARNRAKTLAREWMDFARSSGRDTHEAEELCISAASRPACGLD